MTRADRPHENKNNKSSTAEQQQRWKHFHLSSNHGAVQTPPPSQPRREPTPAPAVKAKLEPPVPKTPQQTRLAIVDAVKFLTRRTPLDDITVKDIASRARVSRQTFYKYFADKYELVNWYFDIIIQKTIKQMGVGLTFHDALTRKFEIMRTEKAFIVSAFSSRDYNNLIAYDYKCIYNFYRSVVQAKGFLTDEADFYLRFYCHASMDVTAEWVRHGMAIPPDKLAELLCAAIPAPLRKCLDNLRLN